MRASIIFLALLALLPSVLAAQSANDVHALVARVRIGDGPEVEKLLPQLEKARPRDPGVLFLKALLESSAEKAVELYQRIADEHADSEWADDALYRLYQYSYAVGAYRTARAHLDRLTARYPRSPFAGREKNEAAAGTTVPVSAKSGTSVSAESPTAEGYSVQVGAYSKAADAEKQVAELKSKGYTAVVRMKEVSGKQVHAVWLGRFTSFEQAKAFAARLKQQQNIDALVVKR
ncbi:MAG: SPOR domain-containing protein [Bacteroidia bacterium]|nr:SPOR domain-containing protein [Bacteroidia bacterium]